MHRIVPLLLLSSLVAQSPAPKVPTFHLTAGEYSVAELLQQVEQAVRAPIRARDAGDLKALAPIRLQCDLALPQQAWADVVGALLSLRDLVVVRDAEQRGHEVLPAPRGHVDWVKERAQEMTVQELFERPAFAGPVRVVVKSKTDVNVLLSSLRMHFAATRQSTWADAVDGNVQLVGLADSVRFGLTTLASTAPDVASTLPVKVAPPWPRNASNALHRLEAGDHKVVQIVDRLAKALGRNIVLAPDLAAGESIRVAKAIEANDLHFEEQLTALLWTSNVMVLQVSGPHCLYEAVHQGAGSWPPPQRVQEFSAAELLARPTFVAWAAVTPAPGGLTQGAMVEVVRAAMRAGRSGMTMGSTHDGGIRLTGLSTDLAAVLQDLEKKRATK